MKLHSINNFRYRNNSFTLFIFRSLCSLVCKWNLIANSDGDKNWSEDYFESIGLSDLKSNNWEKIGNLICFKFFNDL